MYVCMYVCICVCVCVYIYISKLINASKYSMTFTAPIFTKIAPSHYIFVDISLSNFIRVGRKMYEIWVKIHLHNNKINGFHITDFHENQLLSRVVLKSSVRKYHTN